jgi:hypothetical protein
VFCFLEERHLYVPVSNKMFRIGSVRRLPFLLTT